MSEQEALQRVSCLTRCYASRGGDDVDVWEIEHAFELRGLNITVNIAIHGFGATLGQAAVAMLTEEDRVRKALGAGWPA